MSVNVNPPPQLRIPDAFLKDKSVRSFFEQQQRILFQLWTRTGGREDLISNLEVDELYEPGVETAYLMSLEEDIDAYDFQARAEPEELYVHIPQMPIQMFNAVTKNVSYTALPFDFIAMTAKGTIYLPENPEDNDQVMYVNAEGAEVITDGNGKYINDDTSTVSYRKNTTVIYQYFIDLDRWYMRMAIQLDDLDHQTTVEDLLLEILNETKKTNVYNELGHEEHVTEEDIK